MKYGTTLILGSVLIFTGVGILAAQADTPNDPTFNESYKHRYTQDLFNRADTNNDGYVSWNEARESSLAIERDRMGRKRFGAADVNNDGKLTLQEAKKYKAFEVSHRDEAAQKTKSTKLRKRNSPFDDSAAERGTFRERNQERQEKVRQWRDDSVVEPRNQGEEVRVRREKREERIQEKHPYRKERIRERKIKTRRSGGGQ